MTKLGLSITGIEDDRVMACGGISYVTSDVGAIWLRISKKCKTNPLVWLRTIMEAFQLMMESCGGISLYTYVVDGFERGDRMAKSIGMTRTGETEELNGNTYYKYQVN